MQAEKKIEERYQRIFGAYDIRGVVGEDLDSPTGIPLVYELDERLKPLDHYYLGDADEVKKL